MDEESISQGFRLKDIDETRNYLIEEINQKDVMNKKQNNNCTVLNYIELSLILVNGITRYVAISAFASLFGISIDTASSTVGLKICISISQ